jgi:hypothetical protein
MRYELSALFVKDYCTFDFCTMVKRKTLCGVEAVRVGVERWGEFTKILFRISVSILVHYYSSILLYHIASRKIDCYRPALSRGKKTGLDNIVHLF